MTKAIKEKASYDVTEVEAVTTRDVVNESDLQIIKLLAHGYDNKQIADKTKTPLSTIQRRTRILFEKAYVIAKTEVNHKKLGYRRGLVHIYLEHGDIKQVAEKVTKMKSIQTVSLHAGNSDIIGFFLYKNTEQVLGLIDEVKKMEGVGNVVWSEEVYTFPQMRDEGSMFMMHEEIEVK
jgi:Lrp/AsnC family transcriptional regulator, regulator for asnA, asnC and gidA